MLAIIILVYFCANMYLGIIYPPTCLSTCLPRLHYPGPDISLEKERNVEFALHSIIYNKKLILQLIASFSPEKSY